MIQYGEESYKKDLIALWRLCFPNDTDNFIAFYFKEIYKNEETLILLEGNSVVSSLQMIPYSVKTGNTIRLGGYISGVMTHPDYQKKGYMSQLLQASFEQMKEKGYTYTFLIPQEEWLFGFYEKNGYQKAFLIGENCVVVPCETSTRSNLLRNKSVLIRKNIQETDTDDFYMIYSRFLMEKENVILKNPLQVTYMLWDLFEDRGVLFYNDWGSAFIYPQEEKIIVKEIFYTDEEIRQELIYTIGKNYPEKEIIIQNKPNAPFEKFKGLIKSLDETTPPLDIYMSMMLD